MVSIRQSHLLILFVSTMRCTVSVMLQTGMYTRNRDSDNKITTETPIFNKEAMSAIQCCIFCSVEKECNMVFFNKRSKLCKAFQKISDENALQNEEGNVQLKKFENPVTSSVNILESSVTTTLTTTIASTPTTTLPAHLKTCNNYDETSERDGDCGKLGYIRIDSKYSSPCFKVYTHDDRKSQPRAKAACESENARLVVLNTQENADLTSGYVSCIYKNISPSVYFYVGMEFVDNKWYWLDKSTVSVARWSYNGKTDQNHSCAGIHAPTGTWYPLDCPAVENYICEQV